MDYDISTVGSLSTLQIQGGGTCEIPIVKDKGDIEILKLTSVAYAPDAWCNLISLSHLGKKGKLQGRWTSDYITIELPNGEVINRATEDNGLYHMETLTPTQDMTTNIPFAGAVNIQDDVWMWHRKLGHLGWQGMRDVLKMSNGCSLTDKQVQTMLKTICPVCAITKATVRIPREPARRRATQVGELFHADSWGPCGIPGYNGHRHFLSQSTIKHVSHGAKVTHPRKT